MDVTRAKMAVAGGLLGGLVFAVFLTALTRPVAQGEDVTLFLQAESLFVDRDLTFAPEDFERYLTRFGDEGSRIAVYRNAEGALRYDLPAPGAFLAAPLTILGARAPQVLGALLLALSAFLAGRTFAWKLGSAGLIVVLVLLFGSAAFAQAFQATPGMLLLLAGAGSMGLIFGPGFLMELRRSSADPGAEDPRPSIVLEALRYLLAGALLGVALVHHPLYLLLAVAAVICVPRDHRALAFPALAAGALAVLLAVTAVQKDGGIWLGTPAPRGDLVLSVPLEIDAADLSRPQRAAIGTLKPQLDPVLIGWNLFYAAAGRHVGILVYFLPLLLAIFAGDGHGARRSLLLLSLLGMLLFVLLHPFDFAGGGFTNWRILPFYGALFFVVARAVAAPLALVLLALSGAALYPLWLQPYGPQQMANSNYRHVAPLVRQFLPLEASQKNLFRGTPTIAGGLWVRQLSGAPPGSDEMMVVGEHPAEILLASPQPLRGIRLSFPGLESDQVELSGGQAGAIAYRPDGGVTFGVELTGSARHHLMWWSPGSFYLYTVTLRLPEASPEVHPFELQVAE